MNVEAVPVHVPETLVRDFNYLDSSSNVDVYRFFGGLHAGPDIFFTPHNHGHWVVTRYADMEYLLEHTAEFNSETHTVPKEGKPFPVPLVEYDGIPHTEFRKLLAPFFMPKAVHALQHRMQEFTIALIDGFYASGECDFTRDFALKMPIGIMMHVLGLPIADTPYLLELADNLVRGDTPQIRGAAFSAVYAYVEEKVIPLRRASPGDDLFSTLLKGTVDGGRLLTDQEIKGLGVLLVAAGLDTVANMLCFFARFLADSVSHREQLLRAPELMHKAIDELMRRFHVANIARMVVKDIVYKGVAFKRGDAILIPTTLAGIDEQRFENAWHVDFSRADRKLLVFGKGPHQCLGLYLARIELQTFLAEWLKRIPHFRVKRGASVISITGRVNSIPSLPLEWEVSA